MSEIEGQKLVGRWFHGGMAGTAAACCTHPLDLIKVHLQTQQEGKTGIIKMSNQIIKKQGFLALYNGLSASMLRQITYSGTRFGLYEVGKQRLTPPGAKDITFLEKVGLAAVSGACGGFIGTPGDMVNVRMQNDVKLPLEKRRNYKHAFHGVWTVYREEGLWKVFSGGGVATTRAIFVTVGQLSFYDQIKVLLLETGYFRDNVITHFLASVSAGAVATFITQPLDVLKTRQMNAKPGEFRSLWHLVTYTAQLGPSGFFKGFVPAFVRLGPHTVLLFLFLEQLRQNFGVYVKV